MWQGNIAAAAFFLLGGIYIIYASLQMGYMSGKVPGPGFISFWCGVLIGLLSILLLINLIFSKNNKDKVKEAVFNRKNLKNIGTVIGASAIAMFLVRFLGMLISIGLLTGFLSWSFGNKNLKSTILIAVLTSLGFWVLFVKVLILTFPRGLLGF